MDTKEAILEALVVHFFLLEEEGIPGFSKTLCDTFGVVKSLFAIKQMST